MQYEISCVNIRGVASNMIDDYERNRKVSGRGSSRKSQKDESSETPSLFLCMILLVFIFVEQANIVRFGRAEPLLYIYTLSARRDSL